MSERDLRSTAALLRDSVETCRGCSTAKLTRRDLAESVDEGDIVFDKAFELYASFVDICRSELGGANVRPLPGTCGFMNNLRRSGITVLNLALAPPAEPSAE